jgi:lysophospholipid acyltransferase (LPLAT)-like uncharacterized protein
MTGWLLRVLVSILGGTLRWRMDDNSGVLDHTPNKPVIFAFWHNRLFLMPYMFQKYWKPRQRRAAVLVSASKDGEKLARVLTRFNLVCVRGSTSRRGREALRELARAVQDGHDVGITPDGPRGPRYRVQIGAVSLAQLTGATIIPVSYALSRKIALNSWDAFMIPLPFARCAVRLGAPIAVPHDADDALRENKRLELERVLQTLSE